MGTPQVPLTPMPHPDSGAPDRGLLPAAYRLPEGTGRGPLAEELPRCVFVEVTNRCNLLCRTCPRTFTALEPHRTLTREQFVSIVEQFPNLLRGVLHGIGEPLLNRHLPDMISHLKVRGATALFNTNGVLLAGERARAILEAGPDEVRVSVDATVVGSYERIRGKPLLHRVVANLDRFVRLQAELKAGLPRVSIWMTGMRENVAELPELVRLAARVGVGDVYLQRLVYYLDGGSAPGLMAGRHALSELVAGEIEKILARAEAVAREAGVALHASGATDPRGSLAALSRGQPRPWAACLRPWTTSYVTANGNCLPCCMGPFATTDYGSLIMGNLFERDFDEIWNGERYRAWRAALLGDEPPTPCRGCGVHWSL